MSKYKFIIFILGTIIISIALAAMGLPHIIHGVGWLNLDLWVFQAHTVIISIIFSAIIVYGHEEE